MKNELFKVALLQMLPCDTAKDNLEKGLELCRRAKKMGADIALFPEMWSSGYTIPNDILTLDSVSVALNGEFVQAFRELAFELCMAIGITFLEKHELSPRNSIVIFDRFGQKVLTYAKVHTCDFGDELVLTSGEDFFVGKLDTQVGEIKIGAMICFDREFPESARILMLKGAEIVLVPNACPMEINRISQLRARAYENMIGIATANYPNGKPDCNGHSTAFDGVAYLPNAIDSVDTLILEAGEEEGIYLAEFDMEKIRAYRHCEVHGNAYRRPRCYNLLTDEKVSEPFVRADKRKR